MVSTGDQTSEKIQIQNERSSGPAKTTTLYFYLNSRPREYFLEVIGIPTQNLLQNFLLELTTDSRYD